MPIYELSKTAIMALPETTFSSTGFGERSDLQRLFRENIDLISPDTLIIAEEFGDWDVSKRRIDLLGVDIDANLVVIELKRDDAVHMELQAIRYAAMVSSMTFEQAVTAFSKYLSKIEKDPSEARAKLLEFLDWDDVDEDNFAQETRIVLASADFSKELTSSVLWLNDHDLDIRCVRMRPYALADKTLVDIQTLIPLPELAEYQVQVREKTRLERRTRSSNMDFTRYGISLNRERFQGLAKRNAIFKVVKFLCDDGVNPEDIAKLFNWRPNRIWRRVEGTVDAVAFLALAAANPGHRGAEFNPGRWHCDDGELVHANGETYAFSNQWGGERWHQAMKLLVDHYPSFEITYSPMA